MASPIQEVLDAIGIFCYGIIYVRPAKQGDLQTDMFKMSEKSFVTWVRATIYLLYLPKW